MGYLLLTLLTIVTLQATECKTLYSWGVGKYQKTTEVESVFDYEEKHRSVLDVNDCKLPRGLREVGLSGVIEDEQKLMNGDVITESPFLHKKKYIDFRNASGNYVTTTFQEVYSDTNLSKPIKTNGFFLTVHTKKIKVFGKIYDTEDLTFKDAPDLYTGVIKIDEVISGNGNVKDKNGSILCEFTNGKFEFRSLKEVKRVEVFVNDLNGNSFKSRIVEIHHSDNTGKADGYVTEVDYFTFTEFKEHKLIIIDGNDNQLEQTRFFRDPTCSSELYMINYSNTYILKPKGELYLLQNKHCNKLTVKDKFYTHEIKCVNNICVTNEEF